MINKIKKYLKNPLNVIIFFTDRIQWKWISDETYLRMNYMLKLNKKLNLESPKTFNEKLQWLKLFDRNSEYTKLVDKYEVKNFVANKIGIEYVIPTIGVYNNFEEINFDNLPNKFVMKCTHDSGGVFVCKDKKILNLKKIKRKFKKSLMNNFFYKGREWPYKNVKPRIIVEKYMEDKSGNGLNDYKLFCFNGKVKIVLVCSNRFNDLEETFFDENWSLLEVKRPNRKRNFSISKPLNFEKMKELAEKLSMNIPFVRVDFYECGEKVFFGELTFYPASGFAKFEPVEWDEKLGDMLILPIEKELKNEK